MFTHDTWGPNALQKNTQDLTWYAIVTSVKFPLQSCFEVDCATFLAWSSQIMGDSCYNNVLACDMIYMWL